VAVIPRANAHIAFRGIDLTGIRRAELAVAATARLGSVGGTVELRLGSPSGTLLALADVGVTQPAPGNTGAPPRAPSVTVDLPATSGTHDVYFVFRNDRATPIQPLMTLSTITWMNR
jgi:cytochrome c